MHNTGMIILGTAATLQAKIKAGEKKNTAMLKAAKKAAGIFKIRNSQKKWRYSIKSGKKREKRKGKKREKRKGKIKGKKRKKRKGKKGKQNNKSMSGGVRKRINSVAKPHSDKNFAMQDAYIRSEQGKKMTKDLIMKELMKIPGLRVSTFKSADDKHFNTATGKQEVRALIKNVMKKSSDDKSGDDKHFNTATGKQEVRALIKNVMKKSSDDKSGDDKHFNTATGKQEVRALIKNVMKKSSDEEYFNTEAGKREVVGMIKKTMGRKLIPVRGNTAALGERGAGQSGAAFGWKAWYNAIDGNQMVVTPDD